ncbi:MAG: cytochrome c biogenesis protein CcdA [Isosphaeraceae bacterium]
MLHNHHRNLSRVGLTAFLLLIGSVRDRGPSALGADEPPKPAQKDSPTRAKPKDVVLTTSIQPAEARPGDTVTLKVTAKLNPGWHIYTQAKNQKGEGPRKTVFDLFDTAGLEVAGDWKADRKPESRAEPAFDNQTFEYFEDEVSWSIPLKVPSATAPGKKVIRCQASYQICNAQSCSFPGRWTLPDATLTILAAEEGGAGSPKHEVNRPQLAPAPAEGDSSARIRPKGVTLTPSVEPAEAHPGESVVYKVTARLEPGLHIYTVAKEDDSQPGPIPTTFDFFDPGGLKVSGEWKPDHAAEARPEPAFDNQLIEFFENEVTWSTTLSIPAGAAPGKRTLRCQAGYQICNDRSCFPPGRWTLADVALTVLPATGKAAATSSTDPIKAVGAASSDPASRPAAATKGEEPAPGPTAVSSAVPAQTSGPALKSASGSDRSSQSAGGSAAPVSEIAQRAQEGLIPFLIASALGGLFALLMPCVWPMIPITVNFFVKQGQNSAGGKGKGKTTGLAITYCLAIIGLFTAVGVFFSFFFSASFLQNLANNPWLNLCVAVLFVAFGLSLLGLFEIRLPSFLLDASARGESRGGLIGVIFMALTLTITSFTCTFPVVGGLLVMAAGGNFLYPILGLATFATVLALPFFLLALSPSLLSKLPRSGDWLNAVKVVGGLVEIGAALKFLNTAELGYVTPENAWFDAQVVLTAWVVLAAVCGFYLLGFFRTDHDYDVVKVGPGRVVFGALFLGLALYMAPALFGRPPQGLIWDRLIVGILPPDSSEFSAPVQVAGGASGGGGGGEATGPVAVKATSNDPVRAEREEKKVHGVLWGMSLDQAKELAAAQKKPILIDFTGVNCANCRLMEKRVLPRPEIVKLLSEFVTIQLYTDFVPIASITATQRKELAEKNQERQLDLAQEATNPFYVVLTPEGKLVSSLGGYNEPMHFLLFLKKSLEKARGATIVAQAPAES